MHLVLNKIKISKNHYHQVQFLQTWTNLILQTKNLINQIFFKNKSQMQNQQNSQTKPQNSKQNELIHSEVYPYQKQPVENKIGSIQDSDGNNLLLSQDSSPQKPPKSLLSSVFKTQVTDSTSCQQSKIKSLRGDSPSQQKVKKHSVYDSNYIMGELQKMESQIEEKKKESNKKMPQDQKIIHEQNILDASGISKTLKQKSQDERQQISQTQKQKKSEKISQKSKFQQSKQQKSIRKDSYAFSHSPSYSWNNKVSNIPRRESNEIQMKQKGNKKDKKPFKSFGTQGGTPISIILPHQTSNQTDQIGFMDEGMELGRKKTNLKEISRPQSKNLGDLVNATMLIQNLNYEKSGIMSAEKKKNTSSQEQSGSSGQYQFFMSRQSKPLSDQVISLPNTSNNKQSVSSVTDMAPLKNISQMITFLAQINEKINEKDKTLEKMQTSLQMKNRQLKLLLNEIEKNKKKLTQERQEKEALVKTQSQLIQVLVSQQMRANNINMKSCKNSAYQIQEKEEQNQEEDQVQNNPQSNDQLVQQVFDNEEYQEDNKESQQEQPQNQLSGQQNNKLLNQSSNPNKQEQSSPRMNTKSSQKSTKSQSQAPNHQFKKKNSQPRTQQSQAPSTYASGSLAGSRPTNTIRARQQRPVRQGNFCAGNGECIIF